MFSSETMFFSCGQKSRPRTKRSVRSSVKTTTTSKEKKQKHNVIIQRRRRQLATGRSTHLLSKRHTQMAHEYIQSIQSASQNPSQIQQSQILFLSHANQDGFPSEIHDSVSCQLETFFEQHQQEAVKFCQSVSDDQRSPLGLAFVKQTLTCFPTLSTILCRQGGLLEALFQRLFSDCEQQKLSSCIVVLPLFQRVIDNTKDIHRHWTNKINQIKWLSDQTVVFLQDWTNVHSTLFSDWVHLCHRIVSLCQAPMIYIGFQPAFLPLLSVITGKEVIRSSPKAASDQMETCRPLPPIRIRIMLTDMLGQLLLRGPPIVDPHFKQTLTSVLEWLTTLDRFKGIAFIWSRLLWEGYSTSVSFQLVGWVVEQWIELDTKETEFELGLVAFEKLLLKLSPTSVSDSDKETLLCLHAHLNLVLDHMDQKDDLAQRLQSLRQELASICVSDMTFQMSVSSSTSSSHSMSVRTPSPPVDLQNHNTMAME